MRRGWGAADVFTLTRVPEIEERESRRSFDVVALNAELGNLVAEGVDGEAGVH